MRHVSSLAFVSMGLVMLVGVAAASWAAAESSTQPATHAAADTAASDQTNLPRAPVQTASDNRKAELTSLIQQLSDPDQTKRKAAFDQLLRSKPGDLQLISSIVRQDPVQDKLNPEQWSSLKMAVDHLYLSANPPESSLDESFLGVQMQMNNAFGDPLSASIRINSRMPGFPAFTVLDDGDEIIEVEGHPVGLLEGGFGNTVRRWPPGRLLQLTIIRNGQRQAISIRPGPRPLAADQRGVDWSAERQTLADEYWQKEFAPAAEQPGQ